MTRYHNIDGELIAFTAEEETARDKEEAAALTEKAATQYIKNRAKQYASLQDQLDMQYWDSVNGTTTWKDHVAKVKSDNPKP